MTEAEEIAYYTDQTRFPDRLYANGKTYSTQRRLPGGAWVRVASDDMKHWRWTCNHDENGEKRDIIGVLDAHKFLPIHGKDWSIAYDYERGQAPAQDIMRILA